MMADQPSAGNPDDTGGPYQVKLKGIPFEASVTDVSRFLSDCVISGGDQGVTILMGADGRPSGEALVVLVTHGDMVKALNHDRQHMGSRYIEVMFISQEQFLDATKTQPGSGTGTDLIVRLRGLPYSAQVKDIVFLLRDCKILNEEKGVKFTFSLDGRPSGEAFVELCSEEDQAKALAHNHDNMGKRYVEIFKANRSQMDWDCHKEERMSAGETSGVVRLRGLPYGCTEEQIVTFFAGLSIIHGGITIQKDIDGRENGEAFVEFASKDDVDKALARDRKEIQHRYIEVFRSSHSEVKPFKGGRPTPYSRPGGRGGGFEGFGPAYGGGGAKYVSGYERNYRGGRGRGVGRGGGYGYGGDGGYYEDPGYFPVAAAAAAHLGPPAHVAAPGPVPGDNLITYPPMRQNQTARGGLAVTSGNGVGAHGPPPSNHSVRLRGLPYSAKEKDITDFFSPLVSLRVTIDFDQYGRPSGEAEVYFSTHDDANAAMQKNNQHIGHRYIELFLNSARDTSFGSGPMPQQGNWASRGQATAPVGAPSGGAGGYPSYTSQPATAGYQQAPSQQMPAQQYQQTTGYAQSSVGYQPAVAPQSYGVENTGYVQHQAQGQQWATTY